jgi:hypothetical protein
MVSKANVSAKQRLRRPAETAMYLTGWEFSLWETVRIILVDIGLRASVSRRNTPNLRCWQPRPTSMSKSNISVQSRINH